MIATSAIHVSHVSHRYGERLVLRDVCIDINQGEAFVFVGPNGGGKTTLFRLLSTLIPLQEGYVSVLQHDVMTEQHAVRARIGVVFQAPSLDRKLTVAENIRLQAALYGLSGAEQRRREENLLRQLGLTDRARDLVETLSGGLKRRVELAKGMIHEPQLLLMDEPSTALDPGARSDLWEYLNRLRDQSGVTIVMTSHLLEEADRADRMAILDNGMIIAMDTPDALRATIGGDSIVIQTNESESLASAIKEQFKIDATIVDGLVRLEKADGHVWITRLAEAFPGKIHSITLGKPTLEDVFIAKTGHRYWESK